MGFWKTERGIGGDSWADEMGRCMTALARMKAVVIDSIEERKITVAEFADLIEFCSRGCIIAEVRDSLDSEKALSQLCKKGSKTYSNRGQIQWRQKDSTF